MILVDANLLIYAVNRDSPQHEPARKWLEEVLSGAETVGFPLVSVLAFLRLTTQPRVFERPLAPEAAIAYVDEWLSQPPARWATPGPAHWNVLRELLAFSGTAGNLTTDAHLAALAIEHGYTLHSADNDFRRFAGLRFFNPLQAYPAAPRKRR
ncbi:type II toxin-antitoxin system VapC family toxin [Pelomicrobium methylotrophicum]|uniref:Ribonuclease VapC n=1 Tax=Pelomicrobium methylotrophicum TaxID=2602750 RepID=A0A5C7F0W6_9PROT|nr:type II toxin-antitoxin system VapC family toxin [Pelomicrobium methylotrophicum]TXF13344.1 type II toxin-antitoxin system VapC family toxin [Pelomicrobium methylotrophicum]